MNEETEIKIYEIAFGSDARPEHLNDVIKDLKRPSFTEADLIEQLREFSDDAYKLNQAHVISIKEQVAAIKNQIQSSYFVE